MRRLAHVCCLVLLLTPSLAHARDGASFELGFGYSWWKPGRDHTAVQVQAVNPYEDVSSMYDASLQNAMTATLRLGYNVLGHAHINVHFLATGWNVTDSSRGGGGYIGGEVGWHPLQLVHKLLQGGLPGRKYYDFWLEGGYGYSIVGKDRALDGGVGELGLGLEASPVPWFSIGVRTTWYILDYNHYILNYDHRGDPGMTIDLPQHSGGSFFTFTGFIGLHFGYSDEPARPEPPKEQEKPAVTPVHLDAQPAQIHRVEQEPAAPEPAKPLNIKVEPINQEPAAPAPAKKEPAKPAPKKTESKTSDTSSASTPADDSNFNSIFGEDDKPAAKPAPKKKATKK